MNVLWTVYTLTYLWQDGSTFRHYQLLLQLSQTEMVCQAPMFETSHLECCFLLRERNTYSHFIYVIVSLEYHYMYKLDRTAVEGTMQTCKETYQWQFDSTTSLFLVTGHEGSCPCVQTSWLLHFDAYSVPPQPLQGMCSTR